MRIRRVMPEGDDPILLRRGEVMGQPGHHRAARGVVGKIGIQADEMDVRVIEGVIIFRAGREAAALAVFRQSENRQMVARL